MALQLLPPQMRRQVVVANAAFVNLGAMSAASGHLAPDYPVEMSTAQQAVLAALSVAEALLYCNRANRCQAVPTAAACIVP